MPEEFEPYPPFADNIVWLSDIRRADMTPEQLAERHRKDRETYRRMRERMAADPAYREARLAVSRGTSRHYAERNREKLRADQRVRDRLRYAEKREEILARSRELYVGERAQKIRARNRASYARNREARKERKRQFRKEHSEELRARDRVRNRAKYWADPAAWLDYYKEWRRKNIARARLYVRISKQKRRSAAGSFTLEEWLGLLEQYEGKCAYCGSQERIEADHRIPLCRGGLNTIDNILPACRRCNRRKHRKTEDEFRALLAAERNARAAS